MANIGLTNFWFATLTEGTDGTATYGGATRLAKAVKASRSNNNNDASLYADDGLAESDTSFNSASLSLTVDNDDDTIFAPLLGHTITTGEVVKKTTDVAPYVGIGHIVTKMVSGSYSYKVEFFSKVKFSEPSEDNDTKGDTITFATPTIEGKIHALTDGTWNKTKTFTSKAEALVYLKGLLGTVTQAAASETPASNTNNSETNTETNNPE